MEIIKKWGLLILVLSLTSSLIAQTNILKAFEKSYENENRGDYKQAAIELASVYQSDSYEINLRIAWLYYGAGNMSLSEKHYLVAMQLKPYAIEPRLGIAYPYTALGKWDVLKDNYMRILDIDPQNTLVNYRIGLIYYNQGLFEKASMHVEKVLNLYPFDYDAMLLQAWINIKLQKNREAKILFQKVLYYKPGDTSAQEGLSLIK